MLDKRMQMMLEVANTLTADDLETLRGMAPAAAVVTAADVAADASAGQTGSAGVEPCDGREAAIDGHVSPEGSARPRSARKQKHASGSAAPRGEYERQRTRESKVSTSCVGHERERHDWWPVGTDLVGRIGSETFTATVVENRQVKSGRSVLITSGPADGKVCLTPTRAAIEATETYRHANNLGRGGGVTNGWEFWRPKA